MIGKKKWLLSCILLVASVVCMHAMESDGNTYPTAERLFYITRSVNKNLVCYDVNLKDGKLNTHEPLKVYWVNREEHPGETNGLNYIQRKMAYGYKLITEGEDRCECSLTAYPSRKLLIAKRDKAYVCYMMIRGKQAILRSLFVKGSSKNPLSVEYVELRGISVETNQEVTERIKK